MKTCHSHILMPRPGEACAAAAGCNVGARRRHVTSMRMRVRSALSMDSRVVWTGFAVASCVRNAVGRIRARRCGVVVRQRESVSGGVQPRNERRGRSAGVKTRHESVTYGALWQRSHRPQPAEREVLAKEIATNMGLKASASRAVVAKARRNTKRNACAAPLLMI